MCTTNRLGIVSLGLGAISTVLLALAVATDFWLYTKERTVVGNGTQVVYAHIGFWRLCTYETEPVNLPKGCNDTIYFGGTDEDDSSDGTESDSTAGYAKLAIDSIKKVAPLPAVSLLMLMVAFVVGSLGHLRKDGKMVAAAVIYIVVGMLIVLGIFLFIAALSDEISHIPTSEEDDQPMYAYKYGYSFFFCAASFITSQCAAVCCISVFLRGHSHVDDMLRLIPGLHANSVSESNTTSTLPPYHGSPTPRLKLHYPSASKIYNPHFNSHSSPSNSAGKSSNSSIAGTAL